MADFRKCVPALAILILVLGLVSTASAQTAPFQCQANTGVTPLMRSQGLTELTGDILITCTQGTPTTSGSVIPQANISIFYNTTVTSRLLSGAAPTGAVNAGNSEAILMIDDPAVADQVACFPATGTTTCPVIATGGGPLAFKGGVTNIWQGSVSGNSVTFIGIPVEPPGSTGQRVYRVTNVRVNASAVAPGGFGTPGQVTGSISVTPATAPGGGTSSFSVNNPTQVVGYVESGMTFSVRNSGNDGTGGLGTLLQCTTAGKSAGNGFYIRYTENRATFFKLRTAAAYAGVDASPAPVPQDVPGLLYNTESGFYNPALGGSLSAAGVADFGTRLKAVFNNVPVGVSVFVSTTNTNQIAPTSTTTGQIARLVGSEPGAFFPVTSTETIATTAVAPVSLVSGSGSAVWEVLGADPLASQNYDFRVFVTYTASPSTNSPALGQATVNGSFAPVPPAFAAGAGASAQGAAYPVPRFIDNSTASNIFRIAQCRTNLLFPFVTNQVGFDTGLAIANTSRDPWGTAVQQGTCDLNFYGDAAPTVFTTDAVGDTLATSVRAYLASTIAPGFQGYVIAVCNFQFGHGFAFVSDLGSRNLAMGYLALVIPDPARKLPALALGSSGVNGELLGQ